MAVAPSGTATQGSNGTAVASFSASLATGTSVGDLDVLVVNSQAAGVTASTPAGWTLAANGTDNNDDLRVFTRVRQTGDPSSVTVSLAGGTSGYSYVGAAYSGVDPTTPTGTPVATATTTAATTLNVGSLTTTGSGSYRLAVAGIGSGATTFTAVPSGYTEVAQGAGGKRSDLAHAANATPATTGALSFTTSAVTRAITLHLEVLPAGAVTPGTQTVVPTTDVTTTGWTTQAGGTTGLWATVDETVTDDTDYAQSPNNPSSSVLEVKLAAFTLPTVKTGWTVDYRLAAVGAASSSVTVALVQGTTVIASETRTSVPSSFTSYSLALTSTQAGSITDPTDCRLRFTATAA